MVEQPALGPGETLISTVRHGLTELNRDKRVGGRIDLPLIDEGRRQAQEARRGFDGTLFDVIVSSPLGRALDTAEIVTGWPPERIEIDELCTERSFEEMDGIDPADVGARFPHVKYLRIDHIGYSLNPPGGESQQPSASFAAAAFALGLIEARPGAWAYLEDALGPDAWGALLAYRRRAVRDGIRAEEPAPGFLGTLLDLAELGLRMRGLGEQDLLLPLHERQERTGGSRPRAVPVGRDGFARRRAGAA